MNKLRKNVEGAWLSSWVFSSLFKDGFMICFFLRIEKTLASYMNFFSILTHPELESEDSPNFLISYYSWIFVWTCFWNDQWWYIVFWNQKQKNCQSMAGKGRPVLRMTSAFNSFLIVVHPSLVLCSKKLKQNRVKAQSAYQVKWPGSSNRVCWEWKYC